MEGPTDKHPGRRRERCAPVPIPPETWPSAAEAAAARLFSPLVVGAFTTRTRTWVPAMVPWRATEEGFVSPAVEAWYGRFATGLPGVLVAEATGIREVASGPLLRIGHERYGPGLKRLVERVRQQSGGQTRLLVQLIDFLGIRRRPSREKFLGRFLRITPAHRSRLATIEGYSEAARGDEAEVRSALLSLPHETLLALLSPRERRDLEYGAREEVNDLHLEHIRELPRTLPGLFARAAVRAREAGFDGIELHFAHAYTMASFLSRTNVRSDGYGADRAGRLRLALEVLQAVRRAVGSDYTVGCRLLGDEVIEGGSRIEDATYYSVELAAAGMDFISVSKGGKFDDAKQPKVGEAAYPYTGPSGHECMPSVRIDAAGPFGRNLPLSRAIRTAIRARGLETPVVGCGGINSFSLAEGALQKGDCDLVASARQTLADPDWWRKMELGRGSQVRRCLFTNYCEGLDQKHLEVTCQLWDRDFRDEEAGAPAVARSADGKRRLEPPPWCSRGADEESEDH